MAPRALNSALVLDLEEVFKKLGPDLGKNLFLHIGENAEKDAEANKLHLCVIALSAPRAVK